MHLLRSERRLEKLAGVFATPRLSVLNMHAKAFLRCELNSHLQRLLLRWAFSGYSRL